MTSELLQKHLITTGTSQLPLCSVAEQSLSLLSFPTHCGVYDSLLLGSVTCLSAVNASVEKEQ